MSKCGNQHHIGIASVDDDARDLTRLIESDMLPSDPSISALVHSAAGR